LPQKNRDRTGGHAQHGGRNREKSEVIPGNDAEQTHECDLERERAECNDGNRRVVGHI
jgi:hypothetical protein